jgi:hypothetical protein
MRAILRKEVLIRTKTGFLDPPYRLLATFRSGALGWQIRWDQSSTCQKSSSSRR